MEFKSKVMDEAAVGRSLARITHEIIEKNGGAEGIVLLGIKRRGVPLAETLGANVERFEGKSVPVGSIDITLYRDDLSETVELPHASDTEMPCDITDRHVILVDDVMHPGTRIRALDPLLKKEEIDIRLVLVGVLSGHGRDLMREMDLPVDGAYFIPTLRQWFVESTLYTFIGGNTVRRAAEPVPGLLPGINHILPYAAPPFRNECSPESVLALSRCCLESARELMLVLEQVYRETFARNLTLSRLSEAVILPLCPDKGADLHYDASLAASVYLENDLEQLMRGAGE